MIYIIVLHCKSVYHKNLFHINKKNILISILENRMDLINVYDFGKFIIPFDCISSSPSSTSC